MVLGFAVAASAMSYSQAREQALFLTDKMAYELNLTDDQYEAAYEINLDYLLSVNSDDELYGDYWRWRNIDFSYVLLDWQYRMFCESPRSISPKSSRISAEEEAMARAATSMAETAREDASTGKAAMGQKAVMAAASTDAAAVSIITKTAAAITAGRITS